MASKRVEGDQPRILLRPHEAGSILGISRSMIYVLMDQGELPRVRIGRAVRVPRESVEEWARQKIARSANMVRG